MIKVGFDIRVLHGQSGVRGIGKYTKCLLGALRTFEHVQIIEIKNRDFGEVDLVHYPYFDLFFHTLPIFKNKKTIVTIHDCIPLVFPKYYPPGTKGKVKFFLQRLSLRNVSAVLTDSESSRRDIIRFLGVAVEKIKVIYLAADPIYKKMWDKGRLRSVADKYDLPENFILYVGDVNYNKNLLGLIKAFKLVQNLQLGLVMVGKSFENAQLKEVKALAVLIENLKLTKRVKILGFVPDEDLVGIYNLAKVLCMPSYYEGFALQILEAMSCGCPVVTGNVSSMPEVAGGAAVLVNPYKIEEIAVEIEKLIRDEEFRSKIINAGFKRASEFSWQKTAEETIEVYKMVMNR